VTAVIRVSGLVKRYSGRTVVDDVSFEVTRGEIFSLLGPNGAGKTTTVEILEGLRRADAGTVRVLDLDPSREAERLHARVGVMLQEPGVPRALRVREALALIAALHGRSSVVDATLDRVGLARIGRGLVRGLSGGELRRLSLAMALVGEPELLFLDEPTAGLDVTACRATWRMIRDLAASGTTVFLTTHRLAEAEAISTRVGIIRDGRLVALDTPENLVAGDGALRVRVRGTLDAERLGGRLGLSVAGEGEHWVVNGDVTPQIVAALGAALAEQDVLLVELTLGGRTLEDVFVALSTSPDASGSPEVSP